MMAGFECGFRENWSHKNLKYQRPSIYFLNLLVFYDTEDCGKNWAVKIGQM